MAKRLREGEKCGLLQMAIDTVKHGKEYSELDFPSDLHRDYYLRQVDDLKDYLKEVGKEQFDRTTFDIEYNYEDDDDYDEDDE